MEDRDWLILKLLYIHKNITKTAEKLYISQPSLTKRLRLIEQEFGVDIVERGRRGIHFTPKGEFLAGRAEDMLNKMDEMRENVIEMKENVAGTLKLGVSNHYTKYKLPAVLNGFRQMYPEIEFQVTTGWSKDIFNMVNNKKVHIGIISGDYSWLYETHLLFQDPLCIASKEELTLEQLPRLSRIDYQTENFFKSLVDQWWSHHFSEPPLIGIEVDKADTCIELVKSGLGYAIFPRNVINNKEEIQTFDLKDEKGRPLMTNTWMYCQEDFLQINVVSEFVHFLKGNT